MCQVARCLSGCSEKHQASCSSMIIQCFCSIGKLVLAQRWILRLVFLPVNSWGTQQTCHHVTHNSVVTVGMFETCFRIRAGFSLLSNPSLSELRCRKHYNQHSIHIIYHIYIYYLFQISSCLQPIGHGQLSQKLDVKVVLIPRVGGQKTNVRYDELPHHLSIIYVSYQHLGFRFWRSFWLMKTH